MFHPITQRFLSILPFHTIINVLLVTIISITLIIFYRKRKNLHSREFSTSSSTIQINSFLSDPKGGQKILEEDDDNEQQQEGILMMNNNNNHLNESDSLTNDISTSSSNKIHQQQQQQNDHDFKDSPTHHDDDDYSSSSEHNFIGQLRSEEYSTRIGREWRFLKNLKERAMNNNMFLSVQLQQQQQHDFIELIKRINENYQKDYLILQSPIARGRVFKDSTTLMQLGTAVIIVQSRSRGVLSRRSHESLKSGLKKIKLLEEAISTSLSHEITIMMDRSDRTSSSDHNNNFSMIIDTESSSSSSCTTSSSSCTGSVSSGSSSSCTTSSSSIDNTDLTCHDDEMKQETTIHATTRTTLQKEFNAIDFPQQVKVNNEMELIVDSITATTTDSSSLTLLQALWRGHFIRRKHEFHLFQKRLILFQALVRSFLLLQQRKQSLQQHWKELQESTTTTTITTTNTTNTPSSSFVSSYSPSKEFEEFQKEENEEFHKENSPRGVVVVEEEEDEEETNDSHIHSTTIHSTTTTASPIHTTLDHHPMETCGRTATEMKEITHSSNLIVDDDDDLFLTQEEENHSQCSTTTTTPPPPPSSSSSLSTPPTNTTTNSTTTSTAEMNPTGVDTSSSSIHRPSSSSSSSSTCATQATQEKEELKFSSSLPEIPYAPSTTTTTPTPPPPLSTTPPPLTTSTPILSASNNSTTTMMMMMMENVTTTTTLPLEGVVNQNEKEKSETISTTTTPEITTTPHYYEEIQQPSTTTPPPLSTTTTTTPPLESPPSHVEHLSEYSAHYYYEEKKHDYEQGTDLKKLTEILKELNNKEHASTTTTTNTITTTTTTTMNNNNMITTTTEGSNNSSHNSTTTESIIGDSFQWVDPSRVKQLEIQVKPRMVNVMDDHPQDLSTLPIYLYLFLISNRGNYRDVEISKEKAKHNRGIANLQFSCDPPNILRKTNHNNHNNNHNNNNNNMEGNTTTDDEQASDNHQKCLLSFTVVFGELSESFDRIVFGVYVDVSEMRKHSNHTNNNIIEDQQELLESSLLPCLMEYDLDIMLKATMKQDDEELCQHFETRFKPFDDACPLEKGNDRVFFSIGLLRKEDHQSNWKFEPLLINHQQTQLKVANIHEVLNI
ncbi:hypothetical protein FDP41_009282 [Naegleria fowleri]|uniref:Uncharacterized protein n=1 Tax=Naegleria fowleri TaxID=5763 RepID=A0A6A5BH86_NAEFO|nr:uncharacterized protein FDP41_009282 [Naegleria fowleri]KAF0972379.1 hypothetical protein FDP41_009282 [Naegleria fowleri]